MQKIVKKRSFKMCIRDRQHSLDDALEAKRIDRPMRPEDIAGLIDIVWRPTN